MKTDLRGVTIAIIDCHHYEGAIKAMEKTLEQVTPFEFLFFTDDQFYQKGLTVPLGVETVVISKITTKEEYSHFVMRKLYQFINSSHALVIQHDGYVIDGKAWQDEFLKYDYIGATWGYQDGRNVGNGGFSLRSKRLMELTGTDKTISLYHPEDEKIGRLYRDYLESKGVEFAPEEIADHFSFECNPPQVSTFGFHGYFHSPFKPVAVIKRSGAMGDIIMMEPLLEFIHNQGYHVAVDIPADCFQLYDRHHFHVYYKTEVGGRCDLFIDLDMAYENIPEVNVLLAYFDKALRDSLPKALPGQLVARNPKLNFPVDDRTRLFSKYIVLHVDDTAMPHRNVHGVNWTEVIQHLEDRGYRVIQIGNGIVKYKNAWMNCPTKNMMMWVIAGADFFIGIDSGPSQAAVALGVESILFFGSVDPMKRYIDLSNIHVIQNPCPIWKDGCYHKVISVKGQDCEVEEQKPPCITHTTDSVMNSILHIIEN